MKKISYRIILAIAVCSLLISASIGIISMMTGTKIIGNQARETLKSQAENIANKIDDQFLHLQAQAEGLAGIVASTIKLQDIKDNPDYMKQYIDSIKPTAKYFAKNGEININTYVFFNPDYSRDGMVDYLFLINKDGNDFNFDSYDVAVQDMKSKKDEYGWYYAPADAKKGVWSDPYMDTFLNIKLLTYSTPIIVDGNVAGVVGMDIQFDKLDKMVKDIKIYDTGYAFMMNSNYNYLVHPSLTLKDNLKTLSNGIYLPAAREMDKSPSGIAELNFNNVNKIMGFSHLSNGFIITVTVPESEILKDMNNLSSLITILIIAGALLASAVAFLLGHRIARPLLILTSLFNKAETGDLTIRSTIKSKDETGQLSRAFNSMLDKISALIGEAKDLSINVTSASREMMVSSNEVSKVADQIAYVIQDLAKGSTEQASSTDRGNNIITNVIDGLDSISNEMKNSEELVFKAKETVGVGEKAVAYQEQKMEENIQASDRVWMAISELAERSKKISEILEVIKGIADQTNLLALNAAIEAARAGEQGKGFAVVADEVRKLAEQSGSFVNEIDEIIKKVQSGVENAVSDMVQAKSIVGEQGSALDETVRVFRRISESVQAISDNVRNVSEAADKLNRKADEAGQEMMNIAAISQEAAANTEEVSASAEEQTSSISLIAQSAQNISEMAANLEGNIGKFIV